LDGRDSSQVLQDVLLADEPDRKNPAIGERERDPEELLEHEDPLGVMTKSPMPEVRHVLLAAVQKLMQPEVLMGLAAELPG